MEIEIHGCRHGMNPESCTWCLAEKKGKPTFSSGGNGSNGFGVNGVNGYKKFRYEDSSEFYQTIGFLAMHAELTVEVLIMNKEKFIERYKREKGHEPETYYIHEITCSRTWGDKYSIYFELPSWELVLGNIELLRGVGKNKAIANSIDLVWWLLEIGFELGKKHDIEAIKSFVPEKFKEDFDLGMLVN